MSNRLYARRRTRFFGAYRRRYGTSARRYGAARAWRGNYARYMGRIPIRRGRRITGFR